MASILNPSQEIIDQFVGNAHGNFTVVKELCEQYPSMINANATWIETAIEAAAQTGQVEIANYLLEHGAEFDICTAAMLGNLGRIQELLKDEPGLINARGAHGIPLLYFPVIRDHKKISDYLLQRGADPSAASPGGITPLHGAVIFNQFQMARWLLDHGVAPNPSFEGKTPLALAMEKHLSKLVDILRSYGGIE
jgi:ankyrin repeat protein